MQVKLGLIFPAFTLLSGPVLSLLLLSSFFFSLPLLFVTVEEVSDEPNVVASLPCVFVPFHPAPLLNIYILHFSFSLSGSMTGDIFQSDAAPVKLSQEI